MSDVLLPTGTRLGELKDEYPGELLNFLAVQPKVYWLDRASLNDDLRRRRELLALAWQSDAYDASTIDRDYGPPRMREVSFTFGERKKKITMKGFNEPLRTAANLERLRRGEKVDTLPDGTPWRRLEKVRALARANFRRPPRMTDVEKSFRTEYDKRVVLEDGVRTRAIVLDEPVGGFALEDAAQ